MRNIRLLSHENIFTLRHGQRHQEVSFLLAIDNLGFEKNVEVWWSAQEGEWKGLPATFLMPSGGNRELWIARSSLNDYPESGMCPDIQFALRVDCAGQTFWNNNQGRNFKSPSMGGVALGEGLQVAHIPDLSRISPEQKLLPIRVVVDPATVMERMTIYWTADGWESQHTAQCHPKKSRRQTPGARIWQGLLNIGSHQEIEYCIRCETPEGVWWENNGEHNFRVSRNSHTP